ncbi:hypothetical protein [Hymenobacter mucosus]|nr:hypothetical protein [Hymenobacter mucosus]
MLTAIGAAIGIWVWFNTPSGDLRIKRHTSPLIVPQYLLQHDKQDSAMARQDTLMHWAYYRTLRLTPLAVHNQVRDSFEFYNKMYSPFILQRPLNRFLDGTPQLTVLELENAGNKPLKEVAVLAPQNVEFEVMGKDGRMIHGKSQGKIFLDDLAGKEKRQVRLWHSSLYSYDKLQVSHADGVVEAESAEEATGIWAILIRQQMALPIYLLILLSFLLTAWTTRKSRGTTSQANEE